jgi:hypothetical protein
MLGDAQTLDLKAQLWGFHVESGAVRTFLNKGARVDTPIVALKSIPQRTNPKGWTQP